MSIDDLYSVFYAEAYECRPFCGCGDPVCNDALFYVQEYYKPEEYLTDRSFICINCDMSHSRHYE